MSKCDFRLAILKGVIEQGDGMTYFTTRLLGYPGYEVAARKAGLVTRTRDFLVETRKGREVYETSGLSRLPKTGLAVDWDWTDVVPLDGPEPVASPAQVAMELERRAEGFHCDGGGCTEEDLYHWCNGCLYRRAAALLRGD